MNKRRVKIFSGSKKYVEYSINKFFEQNKNFKLIETQLDTKRSFSTLHNTNVILSVIYEICE